jgi:hypothetical protein
LNQKKVKKRPSGLANAAALGVPASGSIASWELAIVNGNRIMEAPEKRSWL